MDIEEEEEEEFEIKKKTKNTVTPLNKTIHNLTGSP